MLERGVDQRPIAKTCGQAHKLCGGALATTVDLQNLLVVVDRHMRRVALGRLGELLERVEIALLEVSAACVGPQCGAERRAGQEFAAVQRDRPLSRLAVGWDVKRTLERAYIV